LAETFDGKKSRSPGQIQRLDLEAKGEAMGRKDTHAWVEIKKNAILLYSSVKNSKTLVKG